MAEPAALPSLAEATKWVGAGITAIDGAKVGEVQGFFVDSPGGEPVWLIARLGRRRSTRLVAVPIGGCAGAAFGVWAAHEGGKLATAPVVDPSRPLLREHELAICEHYGIGEAVGRAAEVAGRPGAEVTAVPPGN